MLVLMGVSFLGMASGGVEGESVAKGGDNEGEKEGGTGSALVVCETGS
jgi:hypothetical protein